MGHGRNVRKLRLVLGHGGNLVRSGILWEENMKCWYDMGVGSLGKKEFRFQPMGGRFPGGQSLGKKVSSKNHMWTKIGRKTKV